MTNTHTLVWVFMGMCTACVCARTCISLLGVQLPSFPVLEVTCGIDINEAFACSGLQASLID